MSDNVQIAISMRFTPLKRMGQKGSSGLTFRSADPNALSILVFRTSLPSLFLLIEFHYTETNSTLFKQQLQHQEWLTYTSSK